MSEDKLSNAEKELFRQLQGEKNPPKELERAIVERLKNEQLIVQKSTRLIYLRWAASIAASIILFISGIYYEQLNTSHMVQIEPTKGYMLLLHEDEQFTPGDPMEMFSEYESWMTSTFESGIKITGQELKEEAVLVNRDGRASKNGKEARTTGYFVLEAETLEEAVQVAKENPHIKYGGTIEVKPYMVR